MLENNTDRVWTICKVIKIKYDKVINICGNENWCEKNYGCEDRVPIRTTCSTVGILSTFLKEFDTSDILGAKKVKRCIQNDFMYLKNFYLLDTVTVELTWYFHKEKEK